VRQSVYGTIETIPTGTTVVNASSPFTFVGTGVDVLAPKSNAAQRFSVAIDGAPIGTFNVAAQNTPQPVIYSARHLSAGTHTISLTKMDGAPFQLGAFRVVPNPTVLKVTNGDPLRVPFVGTGIEVIGPMGPGGGSATVTLDSVQVSTIQTAYPGAYSPRQHYWGISNLTPGPHTLQLAKTGGTLFQVEAFKITP
jgi:hypothetical protein